MNQGNSKKPLVAISKEETLQEAYLQGLKRLGGIANYINEGDNVFLKITLRLPQGYPSNSNFNLIKEVITSCKEAGCNRIYVGSFPCTDIALKSFDELLGIEDYFNSIGAEFLYLDNSDYFTQKSYKKSKLQQLKNNSLEEIHIGKDIIKIPKAIMEADKIIVITQVNVNPLFMCDLSLINYYSILPGAYRKINEKSRSSTQEIVDRDLFRQDLISNILNAYIIKTPILTINDLFYVLEGAGPIIYRDSNLAKTNLLVMGTDLIAVDTLTLRLLGFDVFENDLLVNVRERSLGPKSLSEISIVGEDIGKVSRNLDSCHSNLEEIPVQNIYPHSGKMCSGCFLKAYELLNFIDSRMVKDAKYLSNHSFLVGLNPEEPYFDENVILFGDCAINSTKNYRFRTKVKKTFLKKKPKQVKNKAILSLSGCPPEIPACLKEILDFYNKSDLPNLSYLLRIFKESNTINYAKKLRKWEDL